MERDKNPPKNNLDYENCGGRLDDEQINNLSGVYSAAMAGCDYDQAFKVACSLKNLNSDLFTFIYRRTQEMGAASIFEQIEAAKALQDYQTIVELLKRLAMYQTKDFEETRSEFLKLCKEDWRETFIAATMYNEPLLAMEIAKQLLNMEDSDSQYLYECAEFQYINQLIFRFDLAVKDRRDAEIEAFAEVLYQFGHTQYLEDFWSEGIEECLKAQGETDRDNIEDPILRYFIDAEIDELRDLRIEHLLNDYSRLKLTSFSEEGITFEEYEILLAAYCFDERWFEYERKNRVKRIRNEFESALVKKDYNAADGFARMMRFLQLPGWEKAVEQVMMLYLDKKMSTD